MDTSVSTSVAAMIAQLPELKGAFGSFDEEQELKEAVCDGLINAIYAKVAGLGSFGEYVYGQKPGDQFTSGFLLTQRKATGEDESSDIRIATHGINLKLKDGGKGNLVIRPDFSVYVRVLPSWTDLFNEVTDRRPRPRLRKEVREEINHHAAEATDKLIEGGDKRKRKDIFQEKVRDLMENKGVRFEKAGVSVVVNLIEKEAEGPIGEDESEMPNQEVGDEGIAASEGSAETGEDEPPAGRIVVAESVEGAVYPDDLCSREDIPYQFKRLKLEIPALEIPLGASQEERNSAAVDHAMQMKQAIRLAYEAYIASFGGQDWAWRDIQMKPSDFASETAWNNALVRIRADKKKLQVDKLWPLQEPQISIEWATHPLEPGTIHAGIGLIHHKMGELGRLEADGGLYQVTLSLEVPVSAHEPYVLERVKPAYDIQGFHTLSAAGWNSGVNGIVRDNTVVLTTTWLPRYVLPRIVPNEIEKFDVRFETLANPNQDLSQLDLLPNAFEGWITAMKGVIVPTKGIAESDTEARKKELKTFEDDFTAYEKEVEELRTGIKLLKESQAAYKADKTSRKAIPYRAWFLTNKAFLENGWREKKTAWRLFQVAFVIANIVSPASRMEEFEHFYNPNEKAIESASLLYFATGGGKSEAFFGLLLFTLFLDRMRGKHRGPSALIRYPLRLLTAQQARRLARILARAEIIRRNEKIGGEALEIGFWVGSGSTPNRITKGEDDLLEGYEEIPAIASPEHRDEDANRKNDKYMLHMRDYNKLAHCPFCDEKTALRRYPDEYQRLGIVCLNEECEWNLKTKVGKQQRPLPFVLVDYDIYRVAPPIMLGTVDKLALIGQHWSTINRIAGMLGLGRLIDGNNLILTPCDQDLEKKAPLHTHIAPAFASGVEVFEDPVPSLIIQDEAHLLEESLGTFAGLFETTLYHWFKSMAPILGPRMARIPSAPTEIRLPKVVAATATISDPKRQVRVLYQKDVRQFPHKGPQLYRSFYANPRRFSEGATERMSWLDEDDALPTDVETHSPWARVYVSLLTNGRPHTTASVMILGAFTALITSIMRDLCSGEEERQKRAVDLIRTHLSEGRLLPRHQAALNEIATTKRYDVLAAIVDLHRVALTYVTNKKGGDQILSALPSMAMRQHQDLGKDALVQDILTRLISGGVESGEVESIVKEAEGRYDPSQGDIEKSLRMIVATSAVSHGVDVENFNSMFFAGMPTAIDEYIQASSRVGRTHVGFSLLIPTPQNRRDRFIFEVHETFHRFLERMIAPPAVERWASKAIQRVIPSLMQNWLIGKVYQEQFARDSDPLKKKTRAFTKIAHVRSLMNRMGEKAFIDELAKYILDCVGVDAQDGGAQSQRQMIEMVVRQHLVLIVQRMHMPIADGPLNDFWEHFQIDLHTPMLSLRDVDAPGIIRPYISARKTDGKAKFREMMRFIRDGDSTASKTKKTATNKPAAPKVASKK